MIKSARKEYIFPFGSVTPSCHASTVLPLNDKTVLAAWFGGKREGEKDVEIWLSKRSAGGIWSAPVCVSEKDDIQHWNPVLYQRTDGSVILFYKYGREIPFWQTKYIVSADNGESWSKPLFLVENDLTGGRGPVKNKCIKLSNGVLLAPASSEQNKKWLPFIDRSEDDGLTWHRCEYMERVKYNGAYAGLIQPSLWESAPGNVHCFMRSDKGAIYRSDSVDYGINWCKPYRTRLPNNNSGIDCVKDEKGRIWLLYNPVNINWGVRYPLSLAVSCDNGKHFTQILCPEPDKGEYSYPAITYKDNSLYLTYTYKRQQIVFWKIELE